MSGRKVELDEVIVPSPLLESTSSQKSVPVIPTPISEEVNDAVLGNAIISKKFLRTRKIMVMHSNERGECCLRTLVNRKWKRYDNMVDVVTCLHDRPILVLKVRHLRDLHTFGSVTSHELTIQ